MKQEKLQAIFFDFDGVLVDSNRIKNEAFRTLFSHYGEQIVNQILNYHQQHGGISRVEKIRYAFEFFLRTPLAPGVLDQMASDYSDLVATKVAHASWICGAKQFLDQMKGKVPLFIISGTPQQELQQIVTRRKMQHYFHEVLGSPVHKPDHIRTLIHRYSLNPQNCVFIGDAHTDHHAATLTEVPFIGIQGDYTFPESVTVLPDCTSLKTAVSELFLID